MAPVTPPIRGSIGELSLQRCPIPPIPPLRRSYRTAEAGPAIATATTTNRTATNRTTTNENALRRRQIRRSAQRLTGRRLTLSVVFRRLVVGTPRCALLSQTPGASTPHARPPAARWPSRRCSHKVASCSSQTSSARTSASGSPRRRATCARRSDMPTSASKCRPAWRTTARCGSPPASSRRSSLLAVVCTNVSARRLRRTSPSSSTPRRSPRWPNSDPTAAGAEFVRSPTRSRGSWTPRKSGPPTRFRSGSPRAYSKARSDTQPARQRPRTARWRCRLRAQSSYASPSSPNTLASALARHCSS